MTTDTQPRRFTHEAAVAMWTAAVLLVDALDHMTADQFAFGADREARERLRTAVEDYLQYPWDGGNATGDDDDSPDAA